MRVRTVLAVAALALIVATGCHRHKKRFQPGPPPAFPGSYALSCRNIVVLDAGYVSAECADTLGHFDLSYIHASICKGDIGNNNGLLMCNGAVASTTPPATTTFSDIAASDASASDAAPALAKP